MLCKRFNQGHIQGVGRAHPVGKGLEHVGFGNKTVDVAHRAVAAEVARTLQVGVPALLGRGAPVVDVGNHRESRILHAAVGFRLELFAQQTTHCTTELFRLGAEQGHNVLVVCTVAHVVVDQNQRIHPFNGADQAAGFGRVGLHKVAVEVKVLAVAAGAKLSRTFLVNPVVGAALQHSANVKAGNHHQHGVGWQLLTAHCRIAHQHHARVNSVGFAGVNSVVDEHDKAALGLPLVSIKIALQAKHQGMQRVVGVAFAQFHQLHDARVGRAQCAVVIHHLLIGRRFLAKAPFKNGFKCLCGLVFFRARLLLRPRGLYGKGED